MPLYDFSCKNCQNEFEALVRGADFSVIECPKCHGREVERLVSAPAVSTDDRRQAAAKNSRLRQIRGRKDAIIADEEYRRKHDD